MAKLKSSLKSAVNVGKTYNSKGGFNKHKNTHHQTAKKNPVNEVIVVNEDILKALENGGFIIQEEGDIETVPNSDGMLLVLDSNANLWANQQLLTIGYNKYVDIVK